MHKLLVLLPLICLFSGWADGALSCPQGWTLIGNGCYMRYCGDEDWDGAQENCEWYKGYLIEINTEDEWEAMRSVFEEEVLFSAWIGARSYFYYLDGSKDYGWVHSGTNLQFSAWVTNPGLERDSKCVLYDSQTKKWRPEECSKKVSSYCEIDPETQE